MTAKNVGGNFVSVVTPTMTLGGNTLVSTPTVGTNYQAFASQECSQLTIANDSGTTLEVRQDGAGVALPVFDGTYYTFFGVTNSNQLGVRRKDTSNTQVVVKARWEA